MKSIKYILLFFVIASCGKDPLTSNTKTKITGKVFLKNKFALDSSLVTIMPYQEIFVKNAGATDDAYFTSVKSDAQGNFYIDVATRPIDIFVKTNITIAPNIQALFYGKITVTNPGDNTIQLIAQFNPINQNGFILNVTDLLGGSIPGATVYVYSSSALASTNDPSVAIATLTGDTYGKVFKIGIPAGNYFLNSSKLIDTSVYQRLLKSISVNAAGLTEDSVVLRKKYPGFSNGFLITVTDSLAGLIPAADVYLYNSQVLATSNDPSGAIGHFITDQYGRFSRSDLLPGNYYLNAKKMADTILYQRLLKTITLTANGYITDSIVLRRK